MAALSFNQYASPESLIARLQQNVFGQDKALSIIANAIQRQPANAEKALTIHLVSEAGLGKSRIAQTVAEALELKYVSASTGYLQGLKFNHPVVIGMDNIKSTEYEDLEALSGLIKNKPCNIVFLMDTGERRPLPPKPIMYDSLSYQDQLICKEWANRERLDFLLRYATKVELEQPGHDALIKIMRQETMRYERVNISDDFCRAIIERAGPRPKPRDLLKQVVIELPRGTGPEAQTVSPQ